MRTQHPTHGFAFLSEKAHKSTVWLARHLPQNRDLFMTGGGNGGFNLYKYHYPNSRVKQDKVRFALAGVLNMMCYGQVHFLSVVLMIFFRFISDF